MGDTHLRGHQQPAATPELQQSSGQRQHPQRGSSAPPQLGLSGLRPRRPKRGLRRPRCWPGQAQKEAERGRCMDCQTLPSVQAPAGHGMLRPMASVEHMQGIVCKPTLYRSAAAHLQLCCAQPCMAYATVCQMRDDRWTTEGLGRYLKHFGGPRLLGGAQGLSQLDVDVHGAWLRRDGVPLGGVDGGEGHARRGSRAWWRHVKRPARVAAKDLHLGRHATSQPPWSSRSRGYMLLSRPQTAR